MWKNYFKKWYTRFSIKLLLIKKNGSGWYFKEVLNLEIHTVGYIPMKGSSYIPLPDFIVKKKRRLHPNEVHDDRLTDLKQYENELNFKGIDFPVKVKDITKFENQYPVNSRNQCVFN